MMMNMEKVVTGQIYHVLETAGPLRYGMEQINQLEHALQCASLAERDGASPALITAALLHDIGHLIHKLGYAAARGIDDRHEDLGRKYLRHFFHDDVVQPVALHVAAKRYLCAVEPAYFDGLSPGSVRSLELQGGPFDAEGAEAFAATAHGTDAIRLRRWDEAAKVEGLDTPSLDYFHPYLAASLRPDARLAG